LIPSTSGRHTGSTTQHTAKASVRTSARTKFCCWENRGVAARSPRAKIATCVQSTTAAPQRLNMAQPNPVSDAPAHAPEIAACADGARGVQKRRGAPSPQSQWLPYSESHYSLQLWNLRRGSSGARPRRWPRASRGSAEVRATRRWLQASCCAGGSGASALRQALRALAWRRTTRLLGTVSCTRSTCSPPA
jgi:hypothetical protein